MKWDFEVVIMEFAMLVSLFGLTIEFFQIPSSNFMRNVNFFFLFIYLFKIYIYIYYHCHTTVITL
jgi:hypothetical protein